MAAERVVGWVRSGQTTTAVTHRGGPTPVAGVTAYPIRDSGGKVDILLLLEPGRRLWLEGQPHGVALVLRPGERATVGSAASSQTVEFLATPTRGTAAGLHLDRCGVCHRRLRPRDEVVVCPGCGIHCCDELCASARQCTRCGQALEEVWV